MDLLWNGFIFRGWGRRPRCRRLCFTEGDFGGKMANDGVSGGRRAVRGSGAEAGRDWL